MYCIVERVAEKRSSTIGCCPGDGSCHVLNESDFQAVVVSVVQLATR